MKIKTWGWYFFYQIKFFIVGLIETRFLTSYANAEVKKLKRKNKNFRKLQYGYTHKLLDTLNEWISVFGIIILLLALTYGTSLSVTYDIMKKSNNDIFSTLISLQGTLLFALVAFFPIAAIMQGSMFKDNNIKDELIQIIRRETRVFELIKSSIFLLCYLLILLYLDQEIAVPTNNIVLTAVVIIWFFINIRGVYFLITRGFQLLNPFIRNMALIKYAANEVYPNELASLLKKNFYFKFITDEKNEDESILPKVYFSSISIDGIRAEIEVLLKEEKKLYDVDIAKLKYVICRWKNRNKLIKNEQTRQGCVSIFLPLEVDRIYGNTVCICKIRGDANFTDVERLLIKSAFKFKKMSCKNSNSSSVASCMKIIAESNLEAIKIKNLESFHAGLKQQIDFHLTLIDLSELNDNGENLNYAAIASSQFLTDLDQEWCRFYRRIFQVVTAILSEDQSFFKKSCYVGCSLVPRLLNNPSLIGVKSTIQIQGSLWFHLNNWWKKSQDADTYNNVIKSFIEGWELIKHSLTAKIDHVKLWEEYKLLFFGFQIHLNYINSFIFESILTNNKEGAYVWVDSLIQWNNSLNYLTSNESGIFLEAAQAILSTDLLDKTSDEIKTILLDISVFPTQPAVEKDIFISIIKNYWRDSCLTTICAILRWHEVSKIDNSFGINIINRILKGDLHDNAAILGEKKLLSNNDYIMSILRRIVNRNSYGNQFNSLLNQLDSLTQAERIPGRLSSSVEEYNGGLFQQELILGAFVVATDRNRFTEYPSIEKILTLLKDNSSKDLIYELERYLSMLDKINNEEYSVLIQRLIDYDEPINIVPIINSRVLNENEAFPLDVLKEQISSLKEKLINWQIKKIIDLPLSESKFQKISEEASSIGFTSETAVFPVCLFQQVEWVSKPLKEQVFGYSDFPKSCLTEPVLDESGFSDAWYRTSVIPQICSYLVLDILEEAKSKNLINEIHGKTEAEYSAVIIQSAQKMHTMGLHPILIIETSTTPEWLLNWKHAKWNQQIELPDNLQIQYRDVDQKLQKNYLFHINDIPVYIGNALMGGSLLLSVESLKCLRFRQMDNGYPIDVTFVPNNNDPTKGNLRYRVEKDLVLDDFPIYKISH